MRWLLEIAVIVMCTFGSASSAIAGGWTQDPGEVYAKIWARSLIGNRAISAAEPNTGLVLPVSYQDHQIQVYGEYGVVDRLTLVGYATPVGFATSGGNSALYIGATWAGARFRIYRAGSLSLSAQITAGGRPPVGDRALFEEQVSGEPVVVRPTVGTGQFDGEMQLGIGFRKGWIAVHAGARGFTNRRFLPGVSGYAQFGWKPKEHLVFDLHLTTYQSIGELTELDVLGVTNTRYLGGGLTGSVWFTTHFAVTATFDAVVLASSNAGTPGLNLGIELR